MPAAAADQLKLPEAAVAPTESTTVSMDAARDALFGDELEPGDSVAVRSPSAPDAPAPAAGADNEAAAEGSVER